MKTATIPEVIAAFESLTKYRLAIPPGPSAQFESTSHADIIEGSIEAASHTLITLCNLTTTEPGEEIGKIKSK